jgi:hypothetical protein
MSRSTTPRINMPYTYPRVCLTFTVSGYTCAMAAHGHSADGWFDTPVNLAIGLLMFLTGLFAFFMVTLFLVAKASGF